jgi:Ca2+-binding RTX toxin-like protein
MAGITVGSPILNSVLTYTNTDSAAVSTALANQINTKISNGTLTQFTYNGSGTVVPEPASGSGGLAMLMSPGPTAPDGTTQSLFVNGANQVIVVGTTSPISIQGGAAGGTLLGGSGTPGAARNITYTNITPSGNATDQIAILGGNNLIQTATFGTGNYVVNTGSGNDTINILIGNSTVNAGTGFNQLNFGSGNNLIYSEGYDTITGASVGGGSDTVNIGSGQTSINSGTSSFMVNDSSPNALLVTLGFGVDTVNFLAGNGGGTIKGIFSTTTFSGLGTIYALDQSTGDYINIGGTGNSTVIAGTGNETITGVGTGNNLFQAGTGNDTLVAGLGSDTLAGAIGAGSSAYMLSGTGAGTTFQFTFGKSGGSDTITGFKTTDTLSFVGYGTNPQAVATNGGSVVTLGDGTRITLSGVTPQTSQLKFS